MSWRALAYVEELQRHEDRTPLTCREKLILHVIAYFHDADWRYAEKSINEIAYRTLSSERQVQRCIESCEKHQTLYVHRMRYAAKRRAEINHYYFLAFEKRDGSVLWRQISGVTMTPTPGVTMTPVGDTLNDKASRTPAEMSGKDFLGKTLNTKPAAEPRRGDPPLPAAELEQRRKIEARDRREKAEAAAAVAGRQPELRIGQAPNAAAAGVRVNPETLRRIQEREAKRNAR